MIASDPLLKATVMLNQEVSAATPGASSQMTWQFSAGAWHSAPACALPPIPGSLAFFPALGHVVTMDGAGMGDPAQMYTWNGTTWSRYGPEVVFGTNFGPLLYDAARHQLLHFDEDRQTCRMVTWATSDGLTWRKVETVHAPLFENQNLLDVAENGVDGTIVMWGRPGGPCGSQDNETWVYDGTDWTQRSPAHVPPPGLGAMAFDQARQKTILVDNGSQAGGPPGCAVSTGLSTWSWDGTDWTALPASGSQPPEAGGALVWSAADSGLLYWTSDGSVDGTLPVPSETWLFNGAWTRRA